MELTVTQHDGYTLAAVSGPLDESARVPFREHLHPLFVDRGVRLILDLAGSRFINSQGISNLVALAADANTKESRVILCCVQPHIATVLNVTKLDTFFEIAPDVKEAVARK